MRKYVEQREFVQLKTLLLSVCGPEEHKPFNISSDDLVDFDPALAHSVLYFPKLLLPIFDEVTQLFPFASVLTNN